MNQVIVSYLLGRLAEVADVNPSDVKTSLFHGTIEIQRLTIREQVFKKLPIALSVATIPLIYIKIPSPTSSSPVKVKLSGLHVKVPLHALQQPPKPGKMWDDLHPEMFFTEEDVQALQAAEEVSEEDADGEDTPEETLGDSFASLPQSDISEADLASCQSESDLTSQDASGAFELEEKPKTGPFAFIKRKLYQSAEWVMDRKVEVDIEDTTLEIVIDERLGISAKGSIQLISACVDPVQHMMNESLRHINVSIKETMFIVLFQQLKAPLLRLMKLEVNVSLVNAKDSGKLLRINTAVEIDQIQVALDDVRVGIVAKCIAPSKAVLAIPPYCWPYLPLRKRASWWPYTRECVFAQIRDLRQRYNFNMSHIRFYANSRRRYLRLLDECYRDRLMGNRAEDLEELENDLRYSDVIHFLRELVQDKYGLIASPIISTNLKGRQLPSAACSSTHEETVSSPKKARDSQLSTSVHADVKLIRLKLPLSSAFTLNGIHAVHRLNFMSVSLDDIGFEKDIQNQLVSYHGREKEDAPLVEVEIHQHTKHTETKIAFNPFGIHLPLRDVTDTMLPLLKLITQPDVLSALPSDSPDSSTEAQKKSAAPANTNTGNRSSSTTFLIIPSIRIKVDGFVLKLKSASVTIQDSGDLVYPQYGIKVEELSIACRDEFVLHPLRLTMLKDNSIRCSQARIEISNTVWNCLKDSGRVVACIPDELSKISQRPRKISSKPIVVAPPSKTVPIGDLLGVDLRQWKKPSLGQPIVVNELILSFELLDLSACIRSLQVLPLTPLLHQASSISGCGWGIRVRQLGLQLGAESQHCVEVKGSPQTADKVKGEENCVEVLLFPSGQVAVHLRRLEMNQRSPAFPTYQLAEVSHLEVGIHNKNTAMRIGKMLALEGVEVKDVLLGIHGESIAYQDRPYVASTLQVAASVVGVDLFKVSKFVVDPLMSWGVRIESIVASELVSKPAYNTFYSGFTHMLFSVAASNCPVVVLDKARLLLSLDHKQVTSQKDKSRMVEPVLPPGVVPSVPIVMFADVEHLATYLMIGDMNLRLSAPVSVSSASIELHVLDLTCQLPIPKFEVWNKRVLAKPSLHLNATVSSFELSVPVTLEPNESVPQDGTFRIAGVMMKDVFFEKSERGKDSQAKDASRSNSTAVSTVTSGDDGLLANNMHITVPSVVVSADFSHPLECYRRLFAYAEQFLVIPSIFGHEMVVKKSIANEVYILEETGDLFFESCNCNEILLVDSCTFKASVTGRCLTVCDGTVVLFRHCTFEHIAEHFIRVAGNDAFFYCEECTDTTVTKKAKPAPPDSVTKINAVVERVDVVVQLTQHTYLEVHKHQVEASVTLKPTLSFARVRINGECVSIFDEGLHTIVCSKTLIEPEFSFKPKKKALAINISLTFGEVSIPLISHVMPHLAAIQEIRLNSPPPRRYTVPGPPASNSMSFPLDQWKVLLSVAVVPINLVLRNGCIVAKINVSNGYIWTSYDSVSNVAATLEGHFGVSQMTVLEFSTRIMRPVLTAPIDLNIVGDAQDPKTVSLDVKLSLGEVKLTTDQVRLLTTLGQHCSHLSTTAIRAVNYSGEKIVLVVDSSTKISIEDGEEKTLKTYAALSQSVKALIPQVGQSAVERVYPYPSVAASYDRADAVSFLTYVACLTDGLQVCVVNAITNHFVQEIQLFSMLQIKNETDYTLHLVTVTGTHRISVEPKTYSCIPSYMMESKGIMVSLSRGSNETSALSTVWEDESPLDFLKRVQSDEDEAPEMIQKVFRMSRRTEERGSPSNRPPSQNVYLDFSYDVIALGPVCLFVTPSQPELRSNTLFPMEVDVLNGGGQKEGTVTLLPGKRIHLYDVNPKFPHEFILRAHIGDSTFQSSKAISLAEDLETQTILMQHTLKPNQRTFELTALPFQDNGSHIDGWTIDTPQLCYVENQCAKDIRLLGSDMDPAGYNNTGTLRPSKTRKAQPDSSSSGVYVSLKSSIFLQFDDTSLSEPFEITGKGEGKVVECSLLNDASNGGVTAIALLRPVKSTFCCAMEVVPALLLRNEAKAGRIRLKHEVYERKFDGHCVHTRIIEADASTGAATAPYFTLATPGYANFFSFAWEDNDFSPRMESNLEAGMSWTGWQECGVATHRVNFSKNGPYDPVIIAIGPPQRLPFQFVNLTSSEFVEAPALSIRRCASAQMMMHPHDVQSVVAIGPWDQEELTLSRSNGVRYRLRVAEDNMQEVEPETFMYTVADKSREMTTVIACDWNLNNGTIFDRLQQPLNNITVSFTVSTVSFGILHDNGVPLQFSVDGISFWATVSNSYSLQCTISGISLSTRRKGKKIHVIEPLEINASLRDAKVSPCAISIQSFQSTITPITVIISDYFLGQIYQLASTCANAPQLSFEEQWNALCAEPAGEEKYVFHVPKRVYLEGAVISPIGLEVSWDRTIPAPKNTIQSLLPWWVSLVPSLHHAELSTPRVEFHQLSRDSFQSLASSVQSIYTKELLKQIPKVVGTVGLFKKNTSILKQFASRIGGLFFNNADSNSTISGTSSSLI